MRASEILLSVVIFSLVIPSIIGFFLGRPVFVSYVYSDSMYPTLKRWDVFFINPLSKGDVGDIIVFNLSGKWTVHRVYAITEEGYITKGDNNVATDQQDGKNPPIPRDQVIGKVITVGGKPVKIPGLGKHVNSPLGMALLGVAGLLSIVSDSEVKRRRKRRVVITTEQVYIGLAGLLAMTMIFVGSMSWGGIDVTYASTLAGGQKEGWYLPGSVVEKNVTISNPSYIPMLVIAEGKVLDRTAFVLKGHEEISVPIRIEVPEETRVYRERISVYSYYPILPLSIVERLYSIEPHLPLIIEGLMVFFGMLAIKPLLGEPEVIAVRRSKK
ncbi:signal peptidase I [Pyrococcus kukulkanii]|uniref:signal peptidase I n=1 Tax=Pyrococcus kukulkanii TaxID=1609559 RepID=UPI0035659D6C